MKPGKGLCRRQQQFKDVYLASCPSEACIYLQMAKQVIEKHGGRSSIGKWKMALKLSAQKGFNNKALEEEPCFLLPWRGCQRPAWHGDGRKDGRMASSSSLHICATQCFSKEDEYLSLTILETSHGVRIVCRKWEEPQGLKGGNWLAFQVPPASVTGIQLWETWQECA